MTKLNSQTVLACAYRVCLCVCACGEGETKKEAVTLFNFPVKRGERLGVPEGQRMAQNVFCDECVPFPKKKRKRERISREKIRLLEARLL